MDSLLKTKQKKYLKIIVMEKHICNPPENKDASGRFRIDNLALEAFPINRGVSKGNPISLKLFTATIEEIFMEAEPKSGPNIWNKTKTG